MSQGYIGYHLQQALGAAMHKSYKRCMWLPLLPRWRWTPDDPAFAKPTKPIGVFLPRSRRRRKWWLNIPTKCLWRILAADGAGQQALSPRRL